MRTLQYILITLTAMLMFHIDISAQDKYVVITGKIIDTNGEPVPQAAISAKGTNSGTYSDAFGKYELSLKPGSYTISVSCLGFANTDKAVNLHKDTRQDFTLKETGIGIGTIEVYGKSETQKMKESAFAVNAIDIKPLVNSLNNLNDLVNRTAGIKVREEGGVGSDFDLSINGMSGNSVRYFLDGVPLDTKGSGITLSNLPVNLIDRIDIYKGVVPAFLGTDALGGAINIITKQTKKNYIDVSYGTGSFHTHKADLNAQFTEPKTGLTIRPILGINYSKNDYKMKEVEVWDEAKREFVTTSRKRFHDDYFSLLGQVEAGFTNKSWADAFFISASYTKTDKELQTGSVQSKVYGMAERSTDAWSIAARYNKRDLIAKGLNVNASLSHTWDNSITTDTACRKYDWNGNFIVSPRNEITGRGSSIRHYKRPLTTGKANIDYHLNDKHNISLNYTLSSTGNKRYDDIDKEFEPSNDILTKHILGLSYNQSLFKGKMSNTFFLKDYINHLTVRQNDLPTITGSRDMLGTTTKSYWGGGLGLRFTAVEEFSIKASYERSVRLPLARELLGNGTTIYANMSLKPESSDNFNLGIFGTWHPQTGHTIYYEVNGFLRNVDDYIQATVSEKEGMMQYENLPAIHIKGFEMEARYTWRDRLHLTANASIQEARDQQKFLSNGKPSATYKNRVPNRPWMFGNAEADYTFRNILLPQSKLRLGASYQWVHWYYLTWESFGAKETKARIPEQHIFNINATYSWKNERYNISVECANLLDRTAYDNYKLQKPGRSIFAKFRLFID